MSDENVKKLTEYIDMNLEGEWKDIKAKFDSKFTTPKQAAELDEVKAAVMGNVNAAMRSIITQSAKELGLEGFNRQAIDDEKTTDVMERFGTAVSEIKSGYGTQLEETKKKLEEAQKKGASAKDLEELQGKYNALELKYKDTAAALEDSNTASDKFKAEVAERDAKSFFDSHKRKAFEGVKLNAENEYTIKGFKADVFNSVKLDRDGDELILRDPKTNERIKHPEKAGAFMELPDYVKHKAEEAKLLDTNPHAGKEVTRNLAQPAAVVPENDNLKRKPAEGFFVKK